MSDEEKQLRTHLEKVRENLFFANESYKLYLTILEYDRSKIKNLNIADLLEPIPRLLINDIIISLSKVLEDDSGINLKTMVNNAKHNGSKLIANKMVDISDLSKYRHISFKESISKNKPKIALNIFYKDLDLIYDNIYKICEIEIHSLKALRDKRIAHTDKKDIKVTTTWKDLQKVIDTLNEFVELIHVIFLNKKWMDGMIKNTSKASDCYINHIKDKLDIVES